MRIVRRSEWGFDGWNGGAPRGVDERARRIEFFVHYDGGAPVLSRTGGDVPRLTHRFHKSRGWKGIGYGHVIDGDGTIFEGRGFDLAGSHCPEHNVTGYSVQIHIGGDERPTAAQLAAARWLYDQACRRSGRRLAMRGHRDGFPTTCPGDALYQWVRSGMPAPLGSGGGGTTSPVGGGAGGGTRFEEDDVELTDNIPLSTQQKKSWGMDKMTVEDALKSAYLARRWAYSAKQDAASTLEIVTAMAAAGRALSAEEIEAAAERGARKAIDDEIDNATVTLNTGGTP